MSFEGPRRDFFLCHKFSGEFLITQRERQLIGMGLEAGREADRFRPDQHGPGFLEAHFRKVVLQKGRVPEEQLNQSAEVDVLDTIFFC